MSMLFLQPGIPFSFSSSGEGISREKSTDSLIMLKPLTSLIMLKPLTVWITANRGKFLEVVIPDHLTCLLRNLCEGQEATVKIGQRPADGFQIGKGVHRVCILSPCLFNLYAEYIM